MKNLIERLEQATGPDRELDLAIAIAVWGRPGVLVGMQDEPGGPVREHTYWEYTGKIDDALSLIPEGKYWLVGLGKTRPDEPIGGAQVLEPGSHAVLGEGEAPTPAIAVCIAALAARAAFTPPVRGGK